MWNSKVSSSRRYLYIVVFLTLVVDKLLDEILLKYDFIFGLGNSIIFSRRSVNYSFEKNEGDCVQKMYTEIKRKIKSEKLFSFLTMACFKI